MALQIVDGCIGCGACEWACSQVAISQSEDFAVTFVIDPLMCNDCMDCVEVCPVWAIVPDPSWAVCMGRGCPLSSSRYEHWECSQGEDRCEDCGTMHWTTPDGEVICPVCRGNGERRSARCPKTERARRDATSSAGT